MNAIDVTGKYIIKDLTGLISCYYSNNIEHWMEEPLKKLREFKELLGEQISHYASMSMKKSPKERFSTVEADLDYFMERICKGRLRGLRLEDSIVRSYRFGDFFSTNYDDKGESDYYTKNTLPAQIVIIGQTLDFETTETCLPLLFPDYYLMEFPTDCDNDEFMCILKPK